MFCAPRVRSPGLRVPQGGRFRALQEMQTEVRLSAAALQEAKTAVVIDDGFLTRLEAVIRTILLGHYRIRRQLVPATQRQFASSDFTWQAEQAERLLYLAEKAPAPLPVSLGTLRLLVQCSPYQAILRHAVTETAQYLRRSRRHCQYGVLVHPGDALQPNLRELHADVDPAIVLCHPDQIPEVFGG